MKGMRGKFLKKIKSIKPIGYLKADRILQVNAAEGFFETFMTSPNRKVEKTTQVVCEEPEQENIINRRVGGRVQESDIIDVSELMRDLEEEEEERDGIDEKENIGPAIKEKSSFFCEENVEFSRKSEFERMSPLSEIDVCSFRRPDMNSGSLFDPNLLAAFQEAVNEHIRMSQEERNKKIEQENLEKSRDEERKARIEPENLEKSRESEERNARIGEENLEEEEEEPPHKSRRILEENNIIPLLQFEERCPPGGEESVIFYTTTLRGIRKTFEDCSSVRFLLESFRVMFFERDVSMHMEFKEELWRLLDRKEAVPPRLFIKGRYIGGASEVLGLHERGKLRLLFEGVPIDQSNGPCEGCAGVRFLLCYKCNGSHKVVDDGGLSSKCHECNENGLIICPICR
ncbi:hypothetical protein ACOSP7_033078 [Xanthoceras sorbifolium]|uniref:Glutaredoxin domain-containing protein n=1 Tax=Xanthoceras sorbifolium TaxID=99658 RepID=A0ABQ8H333_9ROSI|nr:hypothetical protein JRO89_XS14G0005400 [Xanthoceras sorbifolium]